MLSYSQRITSFGYISGWIICGSVGVLSILFLILLGSRRKNDDYAFYLHQVQYPMLVLFWRIAVFAFSTTILIFSVRDGESMEMAYFSVWNWILVYFYFIFGIGVNIIKTARPDIENTISEYSWARYLYTIHQLFGELELPMSWILLFEYYGIDEPCPRSFQFMSLLGIEMHLLMAGFMVLDFFLSDYLINPYHLPIVTLWASIYIAWLLISGPMLGVLFYPVLATNKYTSLVWQIVIMIICVTAYCLAWCFSGIKIITANWVPIRRPTIVQVEDEGPEEESELDFKAP